MAGAEFSSWKFLGIEGAYGNGRNNLRLADLGLTSPQETGFGVRVQRYSGNAVVHSPVELGRLRPYVTGGLATDN